MARPTGVTSVLRMPGGRNSILPVTVNFSPVDDVDLARQLGRDPQLLAVGRRREAARARAHHHVLRHVAAVGIDLMHQVADLGGHVDGLAVLADHHALGLGAGRHLVDVMFWSMSMIESEEPSSLET